MSYKLLTGTKKKSYQPKSLNTIKTYFSLEVPLRVFLKKISVFVESGQQK